MFGVGIGMLYTPILVDRLQLIFPSGLAVANILRALTDPLLLAARSRRSAAASRVGLRRRHGRRRRSRCSAHRPVDLHLRRRHGRRRAHRRAPAVTGGMLGDPAQAVSSSRSAGSSEAPARKIEFLIALGDDHRRGDRRHVAHRVRRRSRAGAKQAASPGRERRDTEVHGWRRRNTVRLVVWSIVLGPLRLVAVGHLVLPAAVLSRVRARAWRASSLSSTASRWDQRLEPDLVARS